MLKGLTLEASERVVLQATRSSELVTFDPCLEVLSGVNGPAVTGGQACGNPAARVDLVLEAGTYFVLVSDQFNNATGEYTLLFQRLRPQDAVALTPDVPVAEPMAPLGDLDLYVFTLGTSERVVLQATRSSELVTFDPCLEVLSGVNGPAVTGGQACGNPAARVDLVLEAGTYFVLVSDQVNNATGDYTLLFQRLRPQDAVALTPDVPAAEPMAPLGDLDLYVFTLETSERVVLQATRSSGPFTFDPCLEVLTGVNGPVVPGGQACGNPAARVDLVLEAGTYFVLVSDQVNNATGEYTLLFQLPK